MTRPTYFGYNMPFVSSAGVLPLQADERLVKNDLLILLQTIPGQRVMRPSFGTPINAFPFELGDQGSLDALRSAIVDAVRNNEPRVVLKDVVVEESAVANVLNIKIKASMTINPNKIFEIELQLNLPPGGA